VTDDVFEDGDPFQDPAWQKTKKSRRRVPYIGCPRSWFRWVLPLVRTNHQLAFALCLYRRCCVCGSATVTVPTDAFDDLDISRWKKHRLLLDLERAGIIRVEPTPNGRTGRITLVNWPEPT
jgi:hypothetical protein